MRTGEPPGDGWRFVNTVRKREITKKRGGAHHFVHAHGPLVREVERVKEEAELGVDLVRPKVRDGNHHRQKGERVDPVVVIESKFVTRDELENTQ